MRKDTVSFRITYDTDTDDVFRVPAVDSEVVNTAVKSEITREMWVRAFRSHTEYSSKLSPVVIIDQRSVNGTRAERKVSSLAEGVRIAEAHMSLFQKHVTSVNEAAQAIDQQLDPSISKSVGGPTILTGVLG